MVKRDLALVMDLYELTMSNGYFKENKINQKAVFDMFYRNNPDNGGYVVFAGLNEVINYIQNLNFSDSDIEYLDSLKMFDKEFLKFLKNFKFEGDIVSFEEGSMVYPNEPLITVKGRLIECQIIETALLLMINHESLIATKTNRIVLASKGRSVSDFGARRAHNADAAVYGARASYIGGASATATVLAGKYFNIPVTGTMAHSWVMSFDSEYDAFLSYAKIYPNNCVLLIDTFDTIHSGLKNAIKVYNDFLKPNGYNLKGVRIDSGDLNYLSKKCRKILDENGLKDTKIVVSNALDEYKIQSLLNQGSEIDAFGVGENLITSASSPVLGGVYKVAAIEENGIFVPKIKISESVEKITNPGEKDVYRVFDENGKSVADLISLKGEELDFKSLNYIDPKKPWKKRKFVNFTFKEMRKEIFKDGKLVYEIPSLDKTREYVRHQVDNELWDAEKRFVLPHEHYLDFTKAYYDLKMKLIEENRFDE